MTTLKQPDETIVVATIGETLVLFILETTKPKPHYWKFVSERFNSDESVLSALCRALSEEAGFEVEVERDAQG
ncbi:hypothetical protein HYT05_01505, partial [Candidatus Kaiserbacteria bacterium]|nr:hypothetical protein [Candidatus Kaiserbacteria bacterium]